MSESKEALCLQLCSVATIEGKDALVGLTFVPPTFNGDDTDSVSLVFIQSFLE